jgi:hypothetical protein
VTSAAQNAQAMTAMTERNNRHVFPTRIPKKIESERPRRQPPSCLAVQCILPFTGMVVSITYEFFPRIKVVGQSPYASRRAYNG